MKQKILITGGAGFIGSHLCDFLLSKDYKIICLDNLITGKEDNIWQHLENPNFEFINHNVSNYIKYDKPLDFILHFASPASPVDYLNHPIHTLKVGSLGTLNALGLAKAKKAKFLLASTSEVYGDPLISPQCEDYWGNVNPVGPRGVYDEAKRFAESMTMAFHRVHGIDTKIARIFNTYGPRMRKNDGRVVPNFIMQALNGNPLTIYGDGKQTRSFCYIHDLVEGIYKLMRSDLHEPINLGNPQEISINEFTELIKNLTKSESELIYKPLPQDDPKQRKPDISKAKEYLSWAPKINSKEGLLKTIEWFRNHENPQ